MQTTQKQELNEVFLLRGAASLMVCLFHLILGNDALFPSSNLLEQVFAFGYLGVEIFFILSGYVICYSLPQGFRFSDLPVFYSKRILRIEPPYVLSILLVLALDYFSHALTGLPNQVDFPALLCHLAYVNNFNSSPYVNVVYWTLGIEFQFYVLIGFLFPLINISKYSILVFSIFTIGIACLPMPPTMSVILPLGSYFAIGILLFFFKIKKKLSFQLFIVLTILCLIQLYLYQGLQGSLAAVATILVVLHWKHTNRLIKFFSAISFSLYLIHVPVGGKVINLGMRFANTELSKYILVFVALSVTVGAAYIFNRFVEVPAINLSKRLAYKPKINENFRKPNYWGKTTSKGQETVPLATNSSESRLP